MDTEQKLRELLEAAKCPDPDCDGTGHTVVLVEVTVPRCCGNALDDGGCCNSPVPDVDQEPQVVECQWCNERAEILGKPELIKPPNPVALFDQAFNNELPF